MGPWVLASAAFAACLAPVIAAQRPEPLTSRLAEVTRVSCRFTTRSRVTWKAGAPVATVEPSSLTIGFDQMSPDEGTARAIDWVGPTDIIMRLADSALHFLQSSREGALYVTTIFPKETVDGRLLAVHTRHEYTPVSVPGFTSSPEQYYGDCAATK